MLEHRWEKLSKKACEHAGESDVSSRRVSSFLPCSARHSVSACSLPADGSSTPPLTTLRSLTESPGPSIKCRSQAAQGAAASGFSLLLTSLCTLLASAEKCPPGHWLLRDLTAREEGFHQGLEGASQTRREQQLCCQNMAPGQWV